MCAGIRRRRPFEGIGVALAENPYRLKPSDLSFREMFEASDSGIVIVTPDGRISLANKRAEAMFGYSEKELLDAPVSMLVPDRVRHGHGAHLSGFAANPSARRIGSGLSLAGRRKNGSEFPVDISLTPTSGEQGEYFIAIVRDMTHAKKIESPLGESEARLRALAHDAHNIISIVDSSGRFSYVSESIKNILGHTAEEVMRQPPETFIHQNDQRRLAEAREKVTLAPDRKLSLEIRMQHSDGSWREMETTLSNQLDDPDIRGILSTAYDITHRKDLERQLSQQAFYDSLTRLPNRALFDDRLRQAAGRAGRAGAIVGVMFLDLDRFKAVNDGLGHAAGDQLLVDVAERLSKILRPGDTAARFGGDEFTILLEGLNDREDAARVAERIIESMRRPFLLSNRELSVSTSIGLSFCSEKHQRPDDVLREADIALFRAKSEGRARYAVFDSSIDIDPTERLDMEHDLRRAVDGSEFVVHYQPEIDLRNGTIAGFEALVRWNHPSRGLLNPKDFLSVAEDSGLIVDIDRFSLGEACRQIVSWRRAYPELNLTMSANLSSRHFWQPDLVSELAEGIERAEIETGDLRLEITESVMLHDIEAIAIRMAELQGLGISIALDDFGTGFASLTHLQTLPADAIKIDRSFVGKSDVDPRRAAIVRSIVTLTQDLGMSVTAEGVENAEQLRFLRDLRCDRAQGFYFAEALPAGPAGDLLAGRRTLVHPTI